MHCKLKKIVFFYFGISGHGKGLIDAMSGFGVKGPLYKVVLTEDFSYRTVEDIYDYLFFLFENGVIFWNWYTRNRRKAFQQETLKIKDSSKLHVICFQLDGSIQIKINICSCENCNSGNFIQCLNEKGMTIQMSTTDYDSYDSDNDDDELWIWRERLIRR